MSELSSDSSWLGLRARILAAPWHLWAHAYGSADDVPPLLEALAVGTDKERLSAQRTLHSNVFHQGTRWHASPRAVPFLLEMLALPIPERAWLAEYLLDLALGDEGEFLPRGLDPDKHFANVDEVDLEADILYDEDHLQGAEFAAFGGFARDTYRAVELGCDLLIKLLDDADLSTRLASAHVLAWFPARAEDVSRALLERWDSMSEAEQANALLAMSLQGPWIGAPEQARWRTRAAAMLDVGGVAGRFGAALAMCNWSAASGESWNEPMLQVLATLAAGRELSEWQQQAERGGALRWNKGDLPALAATCLADAPDEARTAALSALLRALEEARFWTSLSLSNTYILLKLAFGVGDSDSDSGERAPIERAGLTQQQRAALEAIAEHGAWRVVENSFTNYTHLVRSFGLPGSQDELRVWLAQ